MCWNSGEVVVYVCWDSGEVVVHVCWDSVGVQADTGARGGSGPQFPINFCKRMPSSRAISCAASSELGDSVITADRSAVMFHHKNPAPPAFRPTRTRRSPRPGPGPVVRQDPPRRPVQASNPPPRSATQIVHATTWRTTMFLRALLICQWASTRFSVPLWTPSMYPTNAQFCS